MLCPIHQLMSDIIVCSHRWIQGGEKILPKGKYMFFKAGGGILPQISDISLDHPGGGEC